jgi:DNA mismatch endonuclease (patch repair protein)
VAQPARYLQDTVFMPSMPTSPSVSARMSRQASRDTAQELALRRLLHSHGLRYRVHVPVPGMPRRTMDIAFGKLRIAIFLDGCFWHGCPEHATRPKTNSERWRTKLDRNIARDRETTEHLEALGWTVLRYWEHEEVDEIASWVEAAVADAREQSRTRIR